MTEDELEKMRRESQILSWRVKEAEALSKRVRKFTEIAERPYIDGIMVAYVGYTTPNGGSIKRIDVDDAEIDERFEEDIRLALCSLGRRWQEKFDALTFGEKIK